MDILSRHISYEETIKGSRFLSELIPCESQAEARELIKAQKDYEESLASVDTLTAEREKTLKACEANAALANAASEMQTQL